jgi:crotonobetainyl-CoA:carnitine CoA-transferase CaiB-like acyl-CoA transferase
MSGVLDGIRVLDFGRFIAGPYCAALLAEHGAEVIRVEKRGGSEDRYLTPVVAGTGEGAFFLQMNRNKLSMTLDPMVPEGREVVRRLVRTADVVVANLPPPTLAAMGLDYDSLKAVKEDIILTTVSAFGQQGPYRERVGFDAIAQTMAGVVYLTGEPGRPYRPIAAWVDFATALSNAFGTLLALLARGQTGRGQKVEASLLATAVAINSGMLIEQALIQPNRVATGNRAQNCAPADLFHTRDGWIVCQAIGRPLFERWARLMGEEHWLSDPRFQDDQSRGDHGAIVSERMARWCAERTTEEALEALAQARLPAGPLLAPQQTLEHPQVRALDLLTDVDYPGLPAPAPLAKAPVWLSETPGGIRRRPPVLGEHTEIILRELGYDAAAIAALRVANVI